MHRSKGCQFVDLSPDCQRGDTFPFHLKVQILAWITHSWSIYIAIFMQINCTPLYQTTQREDVSMYQYLLLNICFMLWSTNRHEKLRLKRSASLWSSYAVIDIGNIHCKCDYVRHSSCYYLDLTVIKIVSSHSTTAAEAPLKAVAYFTQSPLIFLI